MKIISTIFLFRWVLACHFMKYSSRRLSLPITAASSGVVKINENIRPGTGKSSVAPVRNPDPIFVFTRRESGKKQRPREPSCIVSLPVTSGNPAFLKWVAAQVAA